MISRRHLLQLSSCAFSISATRILARADADPWTEADRMQPEELAAALKKSDASLHVICVAFPVLYRQRHITGATLAGPGSKPDGIAALNSLLKNLRQSEQIVLYCGCCPMKQCPNIRPAYTEAEKLGFHNVRVINLLTNFHTDWVEKGYPATEGSSQSN